VLTGPRAPLTAVWFSSDGAEVLTAGKDGIVRGYACQVCGANRDLLALAASRLTHVS
jgi:hypothetical protein